MQKPDFAAYGLSESVYELIEESNRLRNKKVWIFTFITLFVIFIFVAFLWGITNGLVFLLVSFGFYAVPIFIIHFIVDFIYPKHPLQENFKKYQEKIKEFDQWRVRTNRDFWLSLSGLRFEHEVARLLNALGFKATVTKASGDGGIDIIAYDENDIKIIIQCKAHKKPIGPAAVRDLYGVLVASDSHYAMLVSVYGFTQGVKSFLRENGIENIVLMDLRHLIQLQSDIGEVQDEPRSSIEDFL